MNRLSYETSPYLLQHAHNPVNWYPWGDEALQLAVQEDKPILVSIGYSACHWCHVMERESFEDVETARIMNEGFINIKIDREERPDLDHLFMDALQAMTGAGGWPLNVFLTPDGKPFYGGTYFPPRPVHNRPSWKEVLHGISNAFRDKREDIEAQANTLTEHLSKSNGFGLSASSRLIPNEERFTRQHIQQAVQQALGQADKQWGGFGRAPKFPQTFTISFLLRHYHFTKNQEALDQALLSLDKMIMGGIYDHIGGGFARYSTDTEWLAPHFEKMLYDNALLVSVLCDAFQLTKAPHYEQAIRETLAFVERELMSADGGFYSALDADSEGVEGKFYTWSKKEVINTLTKEVSVADAELFCTTYDISEEGNWEHANIPRLLSWPTSSHQDILAKCRTILFKERAKRIRPGLDNKILLGWNGMMNMAFSKAAIVFGDAHYGQIAQKNMALLKELFWKEDQFFHVAGFDQEKQRSGKAKVPAFLDDLALLADALILLFEWTGETMYLMQAKQVVTHVVANFSDEEDLFFYFTGISQKDILVRKKEIYDGATPSGNAIMARTLWRLGIYLENNFWKERSVHMLEATHEMARKYPTSFGCWTDLLQELVEGTPEIAVVGENAILEGQKLLKSFLPYRAIMSSSVENQHFAMLRGKLGQEGKLRFYVCRDYRCEAPVFDREAVLKILSKA